MKRTVIFMLVLLGLTVGSVEDRASNLKNKQSTEPTTIVLDNDDLDDLDNCPDNMVEVSGNYCPRVSQKCLHWEDKDISPEANGGEGPLRCAEFESPSICLSKERIYMHFCISKFEYPGTEDSYPLVGIDYYQAKMLAEKDGNRLCKKEEFNFACEGEDIHPYSYGDGYHRDTNNQVCNINRPWIDFTKFPRSAWNDLTAGLNQSIKSDSNSLCKSVFGVYNMNGNVDEILDSEGHKNMILSGGHWNNVRSRCRPITSGHDKLFSSYSLGTRFCRDIDDEH